MNAEKQQFIDLFKQSGWSQAEVARQLDVERATINGIVTGNDNPSKSLLKFFRLILVSQKPEAVRIERHTTANKEETDAATTELKETMDDLRVIKENDSEAFKDARHLISSYRRLVRSGKIQAPRNNISSKATSDAQALAPAALRKALSEAQSSQPSPVAGGTSGNRAATKRGTGKHLNSPPASPTRVRDES